MLGTSYIFSVTVLAALTIDACIYGVFAFLSKNMAPLRCELCYVILREV
jgi:hypothetical protein